ADQQIAVIVQVETREALRNIDAIAAVDGVDAVFIGPADLAADMGYLGQNTAPAVTEAIDQAIKRIHAAGKASGFIGMAPDSWAWAAARDVTFMAVTCDLVALANTLRHQAQHARETMGITSR
ncbi:MAG: aldolase/citrate lyase family protein, partial [Pseudomonadota bacterium]|nr:aldolase/citrate lyase family protein [Pseudomonadota bacterium]